MNDTTPAKRCPRCRKEKPVEEFGTFTQCPACRDRARQYRKDHREQRAAYNKQYRLDNQEAVRAYGRAQSRLNRQANPEKTRESYRQWYRQLRTKILSHYGTSCACCGSTDHLGIDHVNGDGREHRQELFGNHRFGGGPNFWLWLVENNFPDGYQVLCRPCNRSKGTGSACKLNHGRPASLSSFTGTVFTFPPAVRSAIIRCALSIDPDPRNWLQKIGDPASLVQVGQALPGAPCAGLKSASFQARPGRSVSGVRWSACFAPP